MTGRFDQLLRHAPRGNGHQHAEAFCLMWYSCPCGHRERFWNSRDGVTPFGTLCPSCDRQTLLHTEFGRDEYAPNHKPGKGQRVWIDMTRQAAERYVRQRMAKFRDAGHEILEERFTVLVDSFFEHGTSPDMVVTGYESAT